MYPNTEIDYSYLHRTGCYQYVYYFNGSKAAQAVESKPVVTSTGRKVPKRNPAAKAWVSPYGGKRK